VVDLVGEQRSRERAVGDRRLAEQIELAIDRHTLAAVEDRAEREQALAMERQQAKRLAPGLRRPLAARGHRHLTGRPGLKAAHPGGRGGHRDRAAGRQRGPGPHHRRQTRAAREGSRRPVEGGAGRQLAAQRIPGLAGRRQLEQLRPHLGPILPTRPQALLQGQPAADAQGQDPGAIGGGHAGLQPAAPIGSVHPGRLGAEQGQIAIHQAIGGQATPRGRPGARVIEGQGREHLLARPRERRRRLIHRRGAAQEMGAEALHPGRLGRPIGVLGLGEGKAGRLAGLGGVLGQARPERPMGHIEGRPAARRLGAGRVEGLAGLACGGQRLVMATGAIGRGHQQLEGFEGSTRVAHLHRRRRRRAGPLHRLFGPRGRRALHPGHPRQTEPRPAEVAAHDRPRIGPGGRRRRAELGERLGLVAAGLLHLGPQQGRPPAGDRLGLGREGRRAAGVAGDGPLDERVGGIAILGLQIARGDRRARPGRPGLERRGPVAIFHQGQGRRRHRVARHAGRQGQFGAQELMGAHTAANRRASVEAREELGPLARGQGGGLDEAPGGVGLGLLTEQLLGRFEGAGVVAAQGALRGRGELLFEGGHLGHRGLGHRRLGLRRLRRLIAAAGQRQDEGRAGQQPAHREGGEHQTMRRACRHQVTCGRGDKGEPRDGRALYHRRRAD